MRQEKSFDDSCLAALGFIDDLAKRKIHGHLRSKLLEAEYDKRGTMQAGLFEWSVSWTE
jgi:hypothetical protein